MAPFRRDILVLIVGWLDALEGVGVRADDVVFVVLRGLLNDMLSGQVCVNRMLQVQVQAARYWDIVSLGNPSIMQSLQMSHSLIESRFRAGRSRAAESRAVQIGG